MMTTQNSVMQLLVGKNIARTASVTATDPAASTYAATGEIVVTDVSGTVLNSTTVLAVNKIKIVQSQGATLPSIDSPVIDLSAIKSYASKLYTAPVVQVDYIGYDAVTGVGDINVLNSNGYEILIHDLNSSSYGSIGVDVFGFYVSAVTAVKSDINDGLAINLYQNIAHIVYRPFLVERVSSSTFTTSTSATGTATYTKGSVIVTTSGTTPATDFPVGTYVRVGTLATTTTSLPIYKVIAVSNANQTITLDQPFQGASGTAATTAFAFATSTTVNAGSLGIKLTGNPTVYITPQQTEPYVNRWITTMRNSGSTPAVNEVGATEGIGSYPYTATLEYFLEGNEGFIARNNIPYINPRANVLSTGTYNFLSLEWSNAKTGHIFNQEAAMKQLLIAFDFTPTAAPTQVTGVVTSVQTVLNAWISASIGQGTLA